jgi:hypothetical protein
MTDCIVCEEMIYAWRNLPITSNDRWEIWHHMQDCEISKAACDLARQQLQDLPEEEVAPYAA